MVEYYYEISKVPDDLEFIQKTKNLKLIPGFDLINDQILQEGDKTIGDFGYDFNKMVLKRKCKKLGIIKITIRMLEDKFYHIVVQEDSDLGFYPVSLDDFNNFLDTPIRVPTKNARNYQ